MSDELEILFFANGNTGALQDGEQMPRLQQPWIVFYIEFLEAQGYDPAKAVLRLPGGLKAQAFRTSSGGWNWNID